MKPSEISLFTAKEQTLLVSTESKRLEDLDEDSLAELLGRVRRSRKKYSDLERPQSGEAIKAAGRRSVSKSSAERTLRKAEIFEDAVARVARHLSRAAHANANELKRERLDAAKRDNARPPAKRPLAVKKPAATSAKGKKRRDIVEPARRGATSAANKRSQARKDTKRAGET